MLNLKRCMLRERLKAEIIQEVTSEKASYSMIERLVKVFQASLILIWAILFMILRTNLKTMVLI
jgi:hypothetical protein